MWYVPECPVADVESPSLCPLQERQMSYNCVVVRMWGPRRNSGGLPQPLDPVEDEQCLNWQSEDPVPPQFHPEGSCPCCSCNKSGQVPRRVTSAVATQRQERVAEKGATPAAALGCQGPRCPGLRGDPDTASSSALESHGTWNRACVGDKGL